jgi:hypothetical protein
MLGRIFTVGSYTLLLRLTGFARDIMLAAILGGGSLFRGAAPFQLLSSDLRHPSGPSALCAALARAKYENLFGDCGPRLRKSCLVASLQLKQQLFIKAAVIHDAFVSPG